MTMTSEEAKKDEHIEEYQRLRKVWAKYVGGLAEPAWSAVRDWLDTSGYYDIFVAAQDFREDRSQFAAPDDFGGCYVGVFLL